MASSSSQKKIVLSKPEDWDTWIAFVRIKATNANIWQLINPEHRTQPAVLTEPVEPILTLGATFDKAQYDFHVAKQNIYKSQLAKFDKQKAAFADIINFIFESISAQIAVLIQHVDVAHPYDILRTLKNGIAPTDKGRELQLRNRYDKLKKGPGNQNIETWLNEWQQMYYEAAACKLAEVEGNRAITDFLIAIGTKHPSFADSEMSILNWNPNRRTMHEFIDAYRQHVRVKAAAGVMLNSPSGEHSAFAAGRRQSDNAATFRGNNANAPTCVCGKKHWYPDCFYYSPDIKPAYWRENPEIRKKINESLEDPAVLKRVKNSIAKSVARKGKEKVSSSAARENTTSASESKEKEPNSTFATFRVLATKSSVHNIVVLDCAADIHVCNESMTYVYEGKGGRSG